MAVSDTDPISFQALFLGDESPEPRLKVNHQYAIAREDGWHIATWDGTCFNVTSDFQSGDRWFPEQIKHWVLLPPTTHIAEVVRTCLALCGEDNCEHDFCWVDMRVCSCGNGPLDDDENICDECE